MSDEKITYSVHNYDPVNKYIDEKSRIKNAKSVWAYTKSLTLFLLTLGIFLVLLAYAYQLYKKKYDPFSDSLIKDEKEISKVIEGEKVVYDGSANVFETVTVGQYNIVTGYKYSSVENLRYGKSHTYDYCYIEKPPSSTFYYFNNGNSAAAKILGLTSSDIDNFKKYCKNF